MRAGSRNGSRVAPGSPSKSIRVRGTRPATPNCRLSVQPAGSRSPRRATCTCMPARAGGCRTPSPPSAWACQWPTPDTRSSRMPSATCAGACASRRSIPARCSPKPCASRNAARFRSPSCATSIPKRSCPRARRRRPICANWSGKVRRSATPQACRQTWACWSKKSSHSSRQSNTSTTSSRFTTSCASPAARTSFARGAAPRPIPPCAIAFTSRRSIRPARDCCSNASSRKNATSLPTSTSISNTTGAKRSSSTSMASTAANAPQSRQPSSVIDRKAPCGTLEKRLASRSSRSTGSPSCSHGGTNPAHFPHGFGRRVSIRARWP